MTSYIYELVWRPRWPKLTAYRVARPRTFHLGWNWSGDGENRPRIIGACTVVGRWAVCLTWARTVRRRTAQRIPGGAVLGYIGTGPDFEVYRRSEIRHGLTGWHWQAYSRDQLLTSGDARTRLGLSIALWRARRRLSRQISKEATTA